MSNLDELERLLEAANRYAYLPMKAGDESTVDEEWPVYLVEGDDQAYAVACSAATQDLANLFTIAVNSLPALIAAARLLGECRDHIESIEQSYLGEKRSTVRGSELLARVDATLAEGAPR